jgi:hypothetical protein
VYGSDRPAPVAQGLDLEVDGYEWDEDEVKAVVRRELDDALGQDSCVLYLRRSSGYCRR